jgi:hypothetical protein
MTEDEVKAEVRKAQRRSNSTVLFTCTITTKDRAIVGMSHVATKDSVQIPFIYSEMEPEDLRELIDNQLLQWSK